MYVGTGCRSDEGRLFTVSKCPLVKSHSLQKGKEWPGSGKPGWYHVQHVVTVSPICGTGQLFGESTGSSLWGFRQRCMSCVRTRGSPEKPRPRIGPQSAVMSVCVRTRGSPEKPRPRSVLNLQSWVSACGHEGTQRNPDPGSVLNLQSWVSGKDSDAAWRWRRLRTWAQPVALGQIRFALINFTGKRWH